MMKVSTLAINLVHRASGIESLSRIVKELLFPDCGIPWYPF